MADETKQILIDVSVETRDFDQELGKINTELRKNREEIKELSKDYEENAEEIAKLERENKNLAQSKRQLIKESQTESNSLNALRLRLAELTRERNNLDTSIEGNVDRFNDLQSQIKDTSDEIKEFEQAGGDFRRNVGNYTKSIDAFGVALKATGIGLLIAGLNELRERLLQNQRVLDLVITATNALNIVIDDLISFVVDNFNVVTDFFENPLESIQNLQRAIQEGIQKRVEQLLESLGFLGRAFRKLFEGDFSGALEEGREAARQFVDVFTGEDGGIETIRNAITAVRNYGEEVITTAKAQAELADQARLNEAIQQRTIQQLERQSELQRQIRDDESLSFEERIAANERLGEILEEQAQIETGLLETRVELARLNLEQNNNIENQIALQEALLAQEDALNRIEGQRSEQLTNRIALEKEQQEQSKKLLDDQLKAEADAAKKSADIAKARAQANAAAQQELIQSTIQFAGATSEIGKALAVSQIISDSARGVSGAIAAGAGVPFPANLAAIATGISAVLSGIAQARALLSQPSPSIGGSTGAATLSGSGAAIGSLPAFPTVIEPGLLSQFSQPVQNQEDLVNAANNQPEINASVAVTDIKKGLEFNNVRVSESSL